MFNQDKAVTEFLAGTISPADETELRHNLNSGNWFELIERRDKPRRAAFLKDKSPTDVLLWLMRAGDLDASTRAQCAIALLPYMPPKKDDIEPPNQT